MEVDDRGVRSWSTGTTAQHPLLLGLKEQAHPGLVLFSSGSTGEPKGALHDFVPLLEKFETPRPARRTMAFLLFDHIGGINTLLHTLSNGGTLVVLHDRSPEVVCQAIETNRVELLPTSPTFLNLLLVSGAHQRYDLSSLQLLTYGTEPMSEGTLRRIHEALPDVTLQQTYGLSELGILRSKSKSSDSLWVKIGGEGFETRVVDGLLEIKARSAMLGYLNADSPFTDDGWFKTGDRVEVDGDYYRILGRISEVINVGGAKVDPVEVEDALLQLAGVQDAVVFGEPHDLLGRIVVARVRLAEEEDPAAFRVTDAHRAGHLAAALQDPPEGPPHHGGPPRRALQAHAAVVGEQLRAAAALPACGRAAGGGHYAATGGKRPPAAGRHPEERACLGRPTSSLTTSCSPSSIGRSSARTPRCSSSRPRTSPRRR